MAAASPPPSCTHQFEVAPWVARSITEHLHSSASLPPFRSRCDIRCVMEMEDHRVKRNDIPNVHGLALVLSPRLVPQIGQLQPLGLVDELERILADKNLFTIEDHCVDARWREVPAVFCLNHACALV